MAEGKQKILPASTKAEIALDVGAGVASIVPWLGGPVSAVLSGISVGRKMGRMMEIVETMANDFKDFESEASKTYVKTEEFRELLEKALRMVGEERSEEKRHIYGAFLIDAIKSPGGPYEEQQVFLRNLEQLQPDHIRVLRALVQEPERNAPLVRSPYRILQRRLGGIPGDRIEELVNQLNDLRITNLTGLRMMTNDPRAANLKNSLTPGGLRFLGYIQRG